MSNLYCPPDVDVAYDSWGASCGPTALAALIGVPVMDVRRFFPGFETRKYCNPTQMIEALRLAGAQSRATGPRQTIGRQMPNHGLAFLQFTGGWWDEKPAGVQYRFTHWVAVDHARMYDGNAKEWCDELVWSRYWFPRFCQRNKATGVYCRTAYEVKPCA